jgi:hypothetical protein
MPWYIRRATTLPCHTYHLRRLPSAPTPPTPCHATRRQATPCHVTPCHVTSSCLPLQPIDCCMLVDLATEAPPSERTYAACAINIARVFAHYISYPPPPPPLWIYNLPHHPPWPRSTVNRPSTPPANALARCHVLRTATALTLHVHRPPTPPRSSFTTIITYYCMQVAQTPPCAARHFSSPPQAITTSSLLVSSPLPPPPPPSPPATNCTNVTYATYTTYATTLGPPPPLPLSSIVTITAKLNPPTCSMDPNGEPVIRR